MGAAAGDRLSRYSYRLHYGIGKKVKSGADAGKKIVPSDKPAFGGWGMLHPFAL